MTDLMPPHDLQAERHLLGGLLRWPEAFPTARSVVSRDSFYLDAHGRIWAAIEALDQDRKPIDLVTVHDALAAAKAVADAGGYEYLVGLWQAEPTGANFEYHAAIVRGCSLRRQLIRTATELLRDSYSPVSPVEELIADAARKISELEMASHQAKDSIRSIGDVLREVMSVIDARAEATEDFIGVATGFADLDANLNGLKPGELVIVGARPSLGKTALALNLAANAARAGSPVLFFSLEMRAAALGERMLSLDSGVPMHSLARAKTLSSEDISRIVESSSPDGIGGKPIFFDDGYDLTVSRVTATARRGLRRYGIKLVVVDYLQLIRSETPRENRTQQVAEQTRRLKLLARELDVPVILLSQLNRENDRGDRKPKLSDLRESGAIEQDADIVLLLDRDSSLPPDQEIWPIDVILAKQRNGPVGEVQLAFRRPVMRYENSAGGHR